MIESTVVIVVLAMMAAMVVPKLLAMERSSDYRGFRMGLRRIAAEAREQAISRGQVASVTFDESQPALVLVTEADGEETVLRTLPFVEGVQASRFTFGSSESTASQWRLRFYPDGRSDGGGVQFESGDSVFSLYADDKGTVGFIDGEIPDVFGQKWQAGEREQRL